MQMPELAEEHRKLHRMVGKWVGDEVLSPSPWDPEGGKAIGRLENRVALDGFAVIQDYEQEQNGSVTFRGHGVFLWNGDEQHYAFHWFASMGMAPVLFQGSFAGDVLTLESKDATGQGRATFDFGQPDRYAYRIEVSPDGSEWFPFMAGTYTRQG